jgi:predicted SprT family Zn-dependent metalloprotease
MGAAGLAYRLEWSRRMRTRAGVANEPDAKIALNARLLARHPDEVLPTLVHELAHLVRFDRHGPTRRPHGARWRRLMVLAGFPPTACHRMDVGDLAVRRAAWLYRCATCAREYRVGSLRHRRLERNARAYGCSCRRPLARLEFLTRVAAADRAGAGPGGARDR